MNPQNLNHRDSHSVSPEQTRGFSRRSVVGAAAWSVPVVALSVATPLAAASTAAQLVLGAPTTANVNEQLTVSARLVGDDGQPMVGESITFSVSPTSVGTFGPAAANVTVQTNGTGEATVGNLNIHQPGTLTLVAIGAGLTDTKAITIEASTGTTAFDQSQYSTAANSTVVLTGVVTRLTGTQYPTNVYFTYTGDVTGPLSALVAAGGSFSLNGVQVGTNGGSVTATATNFGQAVATILVTS
ncbi:hypothetical protein [Microbacterium sp. NPDC055665]